MEVEVQLAAAYGVREKVPLTGKAKDLCTLQKCVPHLSSTAASHTKTGWIEMRSNFLWENEILRLSSHFTIYSDTSINSASLSRVSLVSLFRKFKF